MPSTEGARRTEGADQRIRARTINRRPNKPPPLTAKAALEDFTKLLEKENERNLKEYRAIMQPKLTSDLQAWHQAKTVEDEFWAEGTPIDELVEFQTYFPKAAPTRPNMIPFVANEVEPSSSQPSASPQPSRATHLKGVAAVFSPPTAANIRQEALYAVIGDAMMNSVSHPCPTSIEDDKLHISPAIDLAALQESNLHFGDDVDLQELCCGVVHPVTQETITKYQKLIKDPLLRDVWTRAMAKELGRLAQGFGDTKGTNTIRFLTLDEIKNIPAGRTVTYARIVVDYRPQKEDPNRVRITVGGNLIDYPYELTTRTADLQTTKIMWNSVVSTDGAKYACADIGNMYLETPMERREYMRMPIDLIPKEFIDAYDLLPKVKNGYVYMEIMRGMYGLPQAGILANKLLKQRLEPHGYYEVAHTPGLYRHKWRPISFTLVVDDFGIKYVGKEHADHLISALRKDYSKVEVDWTGGLYCGIKLEWNYQERWVDSWMPDYVQKKLTQYNHPKPKRPQHCPYTPAPVHYGRKSQRPIAPDDSPSLDKAGKKRIQGVIGSFLYYARAVDPTILMALSAIAADQANPTERTQKRVTQFLDYMATHPDARIRFRASDMVLNVHSDASYLSAPKARSRAGGYFFLGSIPKDKHPIFLNGAIHITCTILKLVAASAAEAELGALFLNAQQAKILRLTLIELGHPQPATPIHIDNTTTVGIVNNTIKRQKSRSMEMRYMWLLDKAAQDLFKFQHHPGQENLGDYPSKHHSGDIHQHVRPFYVQTDKSPHFLPRASLPSSRRGCVETLDDPYMQRRPLPRLT